MITTGIKIKSSISKYLIVHLTLVLCSCNTAPNYHQETNENHSAKEKFVATDILSNQVQWVVSKDFKRITAKAEVSFKTSQKGYPYLLLNPESKALLNGSPVAIKRLNTSPFKKALYFAMMSEVEENKVYRATFHYSFPIDFKNNKHLLPLEYYKHRFVEMGIPANSLTDRFPLSLIVSISNKSPYQLITNGQVTQVKRNQFKVQFPKYFNSMSFYIDLLKADNLVKKEKALRTLNGRLIKAFIYSSKDDKANRWVSTFSDITEYTFHELEKSLGHYPQETLIVKVSDKKLGGGAYAGAMVLSSDYMEHMSHEIGHSWFLHSVTPANGADTWIYEGFGNWAPLFGARSGFSHDLNLKGSVHLKYGENQLWATKKIFTKHNLRNPHQTGSAILASIDQYLKKNGKKEGLMPILKKIAQEKYHQTMSTQDFKGLLEKHSGLSFSNMFDFYFVN